MRVCIQLQGEPHISLRSFAAVATAAQAGEHRRTLQSAGLQAAWRELKQLRRLRRDAPQVGQRRSISRRLWDILKLFRRGMLRRHGNTVRAMRKRAVLMAMLGPQGQHIGWAYLGRYSRSGGRAIGHCVAA